MYTPLPSEILKKQYWSEWELWFWWWLFIMTLLLLIIIWFHTSFNFLLT
jgi:hypothetical protein